MKCWYVHHKDDEFGDFIFAETRAKAIYKSEAYQDSLDWVLIRAVRVPALDNKKITRENVEAAGYVWFD